MSFVGIECSKGSVSPTAHFHRPPMASFYAEQLLEPPKARFPRGSLYLAAPPGTGKSAFLKHDLLPALEERGVLSVCVETRYDQPYTPGELISDAIERAIATHDGRAAALSPTTILSSVNLTVREKLHWSTLRKQGVMSFVPALRTLQRLTQKPLILVIDESQNALAGPAGMAAMAAVKAARHELNCDNPTALRLLNVGSGREQLRRLGAALNAPFPGAGVKGVVLLRDAFVQHVADGMQSTRTRKIPPLDVEKLIAAFTLFDRRPGVFLRAIADVENQLAFTPELRLEEGVVRAAERYRINQEAQKDTYYLSLAPLARAILWRMLDQGNLFHPFTPESLRFYQSKAPDRVTATAAQNAMRRMRRFPTAPISSLRRGGHAIDDDDGAWLRWYERRVAENSWPPHR